MPVIVGTDVVVFVMSVTALFITYTPTPSTITIAKMMPMNTEAVAVHVSA